MHNLSYGIRYADFDGSEAVQALADTYYSTELNSHLN
jgi:hypothetical protein